MTTPRAKRRERAPPGSSPLADVLGLGLAFEQFGLYGKGYRAGRAAGFAEGRRAGFAEAQERLRRYAKKQGWL